MSGAGIQVETEWVIRRGKVLAREYLCDTVPWLPGAWRRADSPPTAAIRWKNRDIDVALRLIAAEGYDCYGESVRDHDTGFS